MMDVSYTTRVDMYKGHPVLTIFNQAGFRVITLGKSKARALLSCIPELSTLVDMQVLTPPRQPLMGDRTGPTAEEAEEALRAIEEELAPSPFEV